MLSVVLVAPPGESCVDAAIASIGQGAGVEIILVDGCSDGDRPCDAMLAAAADPRVGLLRPFRAHASGAGAAWEHGGGLAAALNRGVAAARGRLVAFLDPRDRWLPGKLEEQLALHRNAPDLGLSFTDIETSDDAAAQSARRPVFAHWPRFGTRHAGKRDAFLLRDDALAQLFAENVVQLSSVMVRRDAVGAVGGFDTELPIAAAWDLWLRLAARMPVGCLPARFVRLGAPELRAVSAARRLVEMALIAAGHEQAACLQDVSAGRAFQASMLRARAALAEADARRLQAFTLRARAWACLPSRRASGEFLAALPRLIRATARASARAASGASA